MSQELIMKSLISWCRDWQQNPGTQSSRWDLKI